MLLSIDRQACISCGACVVLCPARAITLQRTGAVLDAQRCTGCGVCIYKCYARAIKKQPREGC